MKLKSFFFLIGMTLILFNLVQLSTVSPVQLETTLLEHDQSDNFPLSNQSTSSKSETENSKEENKDNLKKKIDFFSCSIASIQKLQVKYGIRTLYQIDSYHQHGFISKIFKPPSRS